MTVVRKPKRLQWPVLVFGSAVAWAVVILVSSRLGQGPAPRSSSSTSTSTSMVRTLLVVDPPCLADEVRVQVHGALLCIFLDERGRG